MGPVTTLRPRHVLFCCPLIQRPPTATLTSPPGEHSYDLNRARFRRQEHWSLTGCPEIPASQAQPFLFFITNIVSVFQQRIHQVAHLVSSII
ncbi:hypothetical protein BCR44DRAFT_1440461, partial [Catenaria anguillulae PL171]